MQTFLPDIVNPWKLATAGECLQGEIPLHSMPRLTSLLNGSAGKVAVVMQAGVDEQNVHFFAGHLKADVEMICQRCMGPLRLPLEVDFRLGLVRSESETAGLPEEYDPLLAADDRLAMAVCVEDELILALPLAPRHEDVRECEAGGMISPLASQAEPESEEPPNPFAVLSVLLTK